MGDYNISSTLRQKWFELGPDGDGDGKDAVTAGKCGGAGKTGDHITAPQCRNEQK